MKQTKEFKYKDLDEDLKQEQREEFLEYSTYPGYDWWISILNGLKKEYNALIIDEDDIEFDLMNNYFDIEGSVDFDEVGLEKSVPEFLRMLEEEWFDISANFFNSTLIQDQELNLNDDIIESDIEKELIPTDLLKGSRKAMFEGESIDVSLDSVTEIKNSVEKLINQYDIELDNETEEILTKIEDTAKVSDLFFQDTFQLEKEDYYSLLENLSSVAKEAAEYTYDMGLEEINGYLERFYDAFTDGLNKEFNDLTSAETIDGIIEANDIRYEVLVDENDNQLQIVGTI